jgi:hypothetical protein
MSNTTSKQVVTVEALNCRGEVRKFVSKAEAWAFLKAEAVISGTVGIHGCGNEYHVECADGSFVRIWAHRGELKVQARGQAK